MWTEVVSLPIADGEPWDIILLFYTFADGEKGVTTLLRTTFRYQDVLDVGTVNTVSPAQSFPEMVTISHYQTISFPA